MEERVRYCADSLLQEVDNNAMIDTRLDTMRAELEELERRLIPLLVTVQRALGKEPSINTRAERRRA